MTWFVRIALGLVVGAAGIPAACGEEPQDKPEIELRWVECQQIEGVTADKGLPSCDPKNIAYPHKKPALVLTADVVTKARLLTHVGKPGSGWPSEFYTVEFDLTKEARTKLAASVEGKETRYLTIRVDGRYWGVHRYEKDKDKKLYSPEVRAETYVPSVGFFNTKAEALRLVDAFK